jgi:hypothetical protein
LLFHLLSKRLKFLSDNGPVPGVHSNPEAVLGANKHS